MDTITKLQDENKKIEEQIKQYESLIEKAKQKCNDNKNEIAKAYQEFFDKKINTEFVYYDNYPNNESLLNYRKYFNEAFPLYGNGELNVSELAEIIKCLYQFKRQEEYKILTIGTPSLNHTPHIFFVIGNSTSLSQLMEYHGKYINDGKIYDQVIWSSNKDLIILDLNRTSDFSKNELNLECLIGDGYDIEGLINYYDYSREKHCITNFESTMNIFQTLSYGKDIKDIFNFYINISDSFIAKILISIIIYKKNNKLNKLTDTHYNHIFETLFNEKVDIIKESEKDIQKKLIYVPKK